MLKTISFPQFERLFSKTACMMRFEFLQFLELKDIVKVALLNKNLNKLVNANNNNCQGPNQIQPPKKKPLLCHLEQVVIFQL